MIHLYTGGRDISENYSPIVAKKGLKISLSGFFQGLNVGVGSVTVFV